MTQTQGKSALKQACISALLVLTTTLLSSDSGLQAQVLAIPANMPILYREIPAYVRAKQQVRYKIKLPQSTLEYCGDGYYLTSGDHEFVILNQNPACLKRFAGKKVAVQGRITEKLVPWHRLYFVVIDSINGMSYEGKVAPWAMREPTDEEIRYWNIHKQLPPVTLKFMNYLALPKTARDSWSPENEPGSDTLAYSAETSENYRSVPAVDSQLAAIQRQLTVIEQKVSKPPYRGIYSVPSENWDSTDWSLYMDLQGGG